MLLGHTSNLLLEYQNVLNSAANKQQTSQQQVIEAKIQLRVIEKKLGYLLQITCAIFAYGMPSS